MITSSKFFQKTLFDTDEYHFTEWDKEQVGFKVHKSFEHPKGNVIPRLNRKSYESVQSSEIFKKQRNQSILPTLNYQYHVEPYKQQTNYYQRRSSKQYVQELNFIKQYVGERNKRYPEEGSRRRLRYKTLDQPVHINTREVFSTKPLKRDSPVREMSVSLTPEASMYNFIKAVRGRFNKVRVSNL